MCADMPVLLAVCFMIPDATELDANLMMANICPVI